MDKQALRARYPQAFAWLAARNVEPSDTFYARLEALRGQAWTVAKLATVEQIEQVKTSLIKALQSGQSFAEWQKALAPDMLALPKHYRETIFRNAVQASYNGAKWAHFRDNPNRPILRYVAVNDSRTRPSHKSLHGLMMPMDDPRWQTLAPSNGHNCFLPKTQVQGKFEVGLKSFYSGEAIEITTRAGNCFAVTANHPILTGRGWVVAHEVKEGDNLLTNRVIIDSFPSPVFDDQYPPTFAEYAFKALCGDGMGVADISAFQFQGDTQLRKSEVYIAGADALLLDGAQPVGIESITKQEFIIADASFKSGIFLDGDRAAKTNISSVSGKAELAHNPPNITPRTTDQTRHFAFAAIFGVLVKADNLLRTLFRFIFGGAPSRSTLAFDTARGSLDFTPLNSFSLALRTANNATGAQALLDDLPADSVHLGESVFTLPGGIGFDDSIYDTIRDKVAGFSETEVLFVRRFFYSGHVYDFQTENGIILADGVVVHNCRCTLMSLSERQAKAMGYDGAPKDLPTWTDKHGHDHVCQPDKGWAHSPENQDLTAYLRDKERKSGLSQAVYNKEMPIIKSVRTPWADNFPDTVIDRPLGDATKHPSYEAAKAGDADAALKVAQDLVTDDAAEKIRKIMNGREAVIIPVHAEEAVGRNAIPVMTAAVLGKKVGASVDTEIVQAIKVSRTGSDGWHRIANPPYFDGDIPAGTLVIMVDDTQTQGGTFAALKGHIEVQGAHVIGAYALTGKQYSVQLRLSADTLEQLRGKYESIETWWETVFGYNFEYLTEWEARYILKSGKPPDDVRNLIIAKKQI